MTAEDREALRRMRETWTDLDDWKTRLSGLAPAAGSELATDDTDYDGWTPSRLAFGGLIAAFDHLHAIRVHLKADNMFPLATGTLLRGALLGGAQTVWMLDPDDRPTRLERARQLAEEMTLRHYQYLDDLKQIAPTPHANTDKVHQHVAVRLADIKALRAKHGHRGVFRATQVIELAAEATFAGLGPEARTEWRGLSGAAHGLMWATVGRSGNTVTPTNDPGVVQIGVGGNPADYLNQFLLTHYIAQKGWELVERRNSVP